jgi:1-acyl-sn-glycerol-3-phosphate acyltransferase
MKTFVGLIRLFRVALHIAVGVFKVVFLFPRRLPAQQNIMVQVWSQQLLAVLGVSLRVEGAAHTLTPGPLMLVANHVSWLDIAVIHAARYCCFVSKDDVQGWPIVGTLATAAGTLYLRRTSRRDARRMVDVLSAALQRGEVLAIFPEGTTGDGMALLPFHGNLLEAAIATQSPVMPVALCFVHQGTAQRHPAPVYCGDTTLLQSLWRTVSSPTPIEAVVCFGAAQWAWGEGEVAMGKGETGDASDAPSCAPPADLYTGGHDAGHQTDHSSDPAAATASPSSQPTLASRNRRQWAHDLQHAVERLLQE